VDGEVGSTGSLDATNVDPNADTTARATGFIGKSSAVTWIQRAARQSSVNREDSGQPNSQLGHGTISLPAASYHNQDGDQMGIEDLEINPYEWPTSAVAHKLVESYFVNVHLSFPVVLRKDFLTTFANFPRGETISLTNAQRRWLCLLNIVFALGARYAHLIDADYRGDHRDHILFFARAKALGMNSQLLYEDAELQRISCLGLLGLYLLANNQLNR
jgi:hypothetical protein